MARPKKETEKYRNHRITIRFTDLEYSIIETENFGTVAQIEVGAMMIGKIKNHQKSGLIKRGEEKGMFLYGGSTIVVLVEKDKVKLPETYFYNTSKDIETRVLYGRKIGTKYKE